MEAWGDYLMALTVLGTQVLFTVVPWMLLYYLGVKYSNLERWELYLIAVPWLMSILTAIVYGGRSFFIGYFAGALGGLVLLQRVLFARQSMVTNSFLRLFSLIPVTLYVMLCAAITGGW